MNISTVKKFFAAGAVLVFSAALLTGCGGDSASAKKFLNIGTGGTAGTYYPIGGAIAEILNKEIPGMNASAQSTGASVANINMLRDKAIDLATVQNDITYYAVTGTEMFDGKKVDGLQGIASLYPETCQFVTLQSSGIKSIADLKGKRVAVGAAGSGVEANVRQILAAYGVSYNDIDAQFLSFAEGASALKDGNVDVAVLTAGYPTASVQDIASQNPVRLLPVEDLMRQSRASPSWRCSSRAPRWMPIWATASRRRSSRISTVCRRHMQSASRSRRIQRRTACLCR